MNSFVLRCARGLKLIVAERYVHCFIWLGATGMRLKSFAQWPRGLSMGSMSAELHDFVADNGPIFDTSTDFYLFSPNFQPPCAKPGRRK